MFKCF